jgi:hypothetical protein
MERVTLQTNSTNSSSRDNAVNAAKTNISDILNTRTSENARTSTSTNHNHNHPTIMTAGFDYLRTTCLERLEIRNQTFLHINSTQEGGFPETQFTHYIQCQTVIID